MSHVVPAAYPVGWAAGMREGFTRISVCHITVTFDRCIDGLVRLVRLVDLFVALPRCLMVRVGDKIF